MKRIVAIVFILLLATSVSYADTLCTSQENVICSCSTGRKIISACASKDLSKSTGYIQYRFGKSGSIELTIPSKKSHPSNYTNGNIITYSGGGGTYLRFINGNYGYVLYSAIGRGWEKEGLSIEKNGKIFSNMYCKGRVTSNLEPDLFEKANIPLDSIGFEIP